MKQYMFTFVFNVAMLKYNVFNVAMLKYNVFNVAMLNYNASIVVFICSFIVKYFLPPKIRVMIIVNWCIHKHPLFKIHF